MNDEHVKAYQVRSALGAPCWFLYYGTSTRQLHDFQRKNCIPLPGSGENEYILLSTDRSTAEYWARLTTIEDIRHHSGEDIRPVILVLDGDGMLEDHYDLGPGDEGELGKTIACWSDIDHLEEVLVKTDEVPLTYHPNS